MLKRLLGKGKKPEEEKQDVDPELAIKKLDEQFKAVEKRINVIETRAKESKVIALSKRKAKDERGALNALRQMKMFEKELQKLDGQQAVLAQQRMMIESTHFDVKIVKTM